jgi:hypothetical protein
MSQNMGVYSMAGATRGIGIGPGSPNNWSAYPALSPILRDALDGMMTPNAFKALHYHSDTFDKLFHLRRMRFNELPLFRIDQRSALPASTELDGFTVVNYAGSIVETLQTDDARAGFRAVFNRSRDMMGCNYRVFIRNVREGNTQDVDSLNNMGFSFSMHRSDQPPYLVLRGFYPYFSAGDGDNVMLFFFHQVLECLVLIVAPVTEREHALNFIRMHGMLHTFDKMCALCGKTGGLLKCHGCKAVRYCDRECQAQHWMSHKAECRAARKRESAVV